LSYEGADAIIDGFPSSGNFSPNPATSWCPMRRFVPLGLLLLIASTATAQNKPRQELKEVAPEAVDTAVYQRLKYRYIGPEGNRVTSVTGVAGDPNTYYAGAASGGLWKSTDGGIHWDPVFDKEPVSSVGALAVAPSDPNVVYAGTGEPFTRSHISAGWGMFRSTDAGKSWTRAGLENTGRIARIVVSPANPDLVYAASLGFAYGPQPERGIRGCALFRNDGRGRFREVSDESGPFFHEALRWNDGGKASFADSGEAVVSAPEVPLPYPLAAIILEVAPVLLEPERGVHLAAEVVTRLQPVAMFLTGAAVGPLPVERRQQERHVPEAALG